MPPPLSIVICTRNRKARIVSTLQSIFLNAHAQFEVIVIDQSENEVTREAVQPFLNDVRFIYKKSTTKGLSIARNIGLSECRGSIIAFTDDDCRVTETWIKAILTEYETHPQIDAVFGKIFQGEISDISALDRNIDLAQAQRLQQVLPIAKKEETTYELYKDDANNLGFGHGANMSFRQSVFSRYGEFDEFLSAGASLGAWEDRDMGHRILAGGGQILYSPHVVVYHDHWREWPEVKRSFKNYGIGTGTAVNKYMRSGEWRSLPILGGWIVQLGIRQILSGIFKWQSWEKTIIGFSQIIYPCIGFLKGFRHPIDRQKKLFTNGKTNHE